MRVSDDEMHEAIFTVFRYLKERPDAVNKIVSDEFLASLSRDVRARLFSRYMTLESEPERIYLYFFFNLSAARKSKCKTYQEETEVWLPGTLQAIKTIREVSDKSLLESKNILEALSKYDFRTDEGMILNITPQELPVSNTISVARAIEKLADVGIVARRS